MNYTINIKNNKINIYIYIVIKLYFRLMIILKKLIKRNFNIVHQTLIMTIYSFSSYYILLINKYFYIILI